MDRTGRDELIRRYQTDYMEKVFYFCLKKTGSAADAEELASDITVNILSSLHGGAAPRQFSGWVWAIARNRYARWIRERRRTADSLDRDEAASLALCDGQPSPEERLIRREQLSLLRRELAFISRDFRRIIAAYYLEGRRIGDIACEMRLPPGTVMTRLHRGRKALKEGMDMAREFGRRSYQPENISFSSSGNQPSGLPWSAVQRMIPMNILCAANNDPQTVEDLAMELGIAAAYMEEEVSLLEKAELLKKLDGGRFMTSFFISPRECQTEIMALGCDFVEQHADGLWHTARILMERLRAKGCDTSALADNDAHMFFALLLECALERDALPPDIYHAFKRHDGGDWGFMGFEHGAQCRLPMAPFSNTSSIFHDCAWYSFHADSDGPFHNRIYTADTPDAHQLLLLRAIAQGKTPPEESALDLDYLLRVGICRRREDGSPYVHAIILPSAIFHHETDIIRDTKEHQALLEHMHRYVAGVRQILAKYCHQALRDDFDYYAAMSLNLRFIFAAWCASHGYYTGDLAQFCALYC